MAESVVQPRVGYYMVEEKNQVEVIWQSICSDRYEKVGSMAGFVFPSANSITDVCCMEEIFGGQETRPVRTWRIPLRLTVEEVEEIRKLTAEKKAEELFTLFEKLTGHYHDALPTREDVASSR